MGLEFGSSASLPLMRIRMRDTWLSLDILHIDYRANLIESITFFQRPLSNYSRRMEGRAAQSSLMRGVRAGASNVLFVQGYLYASNVCR